MGDGVYLTHDACCPAQWVRSDKTREGAQGAGLWRVGSGHPGRVGRSVERWGAWPVTEIVEGAWHPALATLSNAAGWLGVV